MSQEDFAVGSTTIQLSVGDERRPSLDARSSHEMGIWSKRAPVGLAIRQETEPDVSQRVTTQTDVSRGYCATGKARDENGRRVPSIVLQDPNQIRLHKLGALH